jgi:hypothetical protein
MQSNKTAILQIYVVILLFCHKTAILYSCYFVIYVTRSGDSAEYVVSVSVSSEDSLCPEVQYVLPSSCMHECYLSVCLMHACLPYAYMCA